MAGGAWSCWLWPYLCILIGPCEEGASNLGFALKQTNLDWLRIEKPMSCGEVLECHQSRGTGANDGHTHDVCWLCFVWKESGVPYGRVERRLSRLAKVKESVGNGTGQGGLGRGGGCWNQQPSIFLSLPSSGPRPILYDGPLPLPICQELIIGKLGGTECCNDKPRSGPALLERERGITDERSVWLAGEDRCS